MKRGLAIPFGSLEQGAYVLAALAGADLPLALAVERWEPDGSKHRLQRTYAFSERQGGRSTAPAELPVQGAADSLVAAAFDTGVPMIGTRLEAEPVPIAATASAVGASALLAIPVVWGGSVIRSVAVLYL